MIIYTWIILLLSSFQLAYGISLDVNVYLHSDYEDEAHMESIRYTIINNTEPLDVSFRGNSNTLMNLLNQELDANIKELMRVSC